MNEPILHLAKRAIRNPEQLRAAEIKRLGQWVELAYRQRERETCRDGSNFTIEGSKILEIGRQSLTPDSVKASEGSGGK